MACLCYSEGSWIVALTLLVLRPPLIWTRDIPSRFLMQGKCECRFSNGTERVRYLASYVYNRDVLALFDSEVGEFAAVTELGGADAERWNRQRDFLQQLRAEVDRFCRHNYRVLRRVLARRGAKPLVTVSPAKTQPLQHHNLLVCSVNGFYLGAVEVRWLRNGQEEEEAEVISTGLVANGDWTFQTQVMLEIVPQSGDVYSCQVEHPSLQSPITVEWRAQSEFAQRKMLSGSAGFALGLLFLRAGLFVYFRHQKGLLT